MINKSYSQVSEAIKSKFRIINSKFIVRVVLGALMLNSFLVLASKNQAYLILMVICIALGVCYEVIFITKKPNTPFPINNGLTMYFSMIIFWYKVGIGLIVTYKKRSTLAIISSIKVFFFAAYTFGLILFVISLKRNRLSLQLLLITVIHMISYISGLTCSLAIKNITFGKFFFIFPCLLVITNDIGAYLVGKAIGKTPLISVSPHKTLEGFVGGFLFTVVISFMCSYLKIRHKFLPDVHDQGLAQSVNTKLWYLDFPAIYIHSMSFACAASFLAPLTGFIASAVKRVFKKKDFGSVIPGHGGVVDRMDCQVLMVYFTYYYLKATSIVQSSSVSSVYDYLINNLDRDEFEILKKMISVNH